MPIRGNNVFDLSANKYNSQNTSKKAMPDRVTQEKNASVFSEDKVSLSKQEKKEPSSLFKSYNTNNRNQQRKNWLNQEIQRLQYDIGQKRRKAGELKHKIGSNRQRRDSLKNELSNMRWRLNSAEDKFSGLESQLQNVKRKLRNPNVKGDERMRLEDRRSNLTDKIYNMKSRIYDMKSRIQEKEYKMNECESEANSASYELEGLRNEMRNQRDQIQAYQQELANLG